MVGGMKMVISEEITPPTIVQLDEQIHFHHEVNHTP